MGKIDIKRKRDDDEEIDNVKLNKKNNDSLNYGEFISKCFRCRKLKTMNVFEDTDGACDDCNDLKDFDRPEISLMCQLQFNVEKNNKEQKIEQEEEEEGTTEEEEEEEEGEEYQLVDESKLSPLMKIFFSDRIKKAFEEKYFKSFGKETIDEYDKKKERDSLFGYTYESVEFTDELWNLFHSTYLLKKSDTVFKICRRYNAEDDFLYYENNAGFDDDTDCDILNYYIYICDKNGEEMIGDDAEMVAELVVRLFKTRVTFEELGSGGVMAAQCQKFD